MSLALCTFFRAQSHTHDKRGAVTAAEFLIALPCLTYSLLSAIWAIRKLQAALQGFR